jgi:hypothetical protein
VLFLLVLQTVATMDHIRLIWSTLAIASFVALVVVLGCWLWCKYYKQQQVAPGPMNWPLLGAVPELLSNWDRLHDWFLDYFRHTRSFRIPFQLNFTGVFTVDPACVEQLLKSKCYNYPKVLIKAFASSCLFPILQGTHFYYMQISSSSTCLKTFKQPVSHYLD